MKSELLFYLMMVEKEVEYTEARSVKRNRRVRDRKINLFKKLNSLKRKNKLGMGVGIRFYA
jgi:hypothetical protein